MAKNIVYQDKLLYPKILWQRPVHYYKSEAGKIMVLAGSRNMTGAAILTCEAIFRSGTGIILLGYPKSLRYVYKDFMPEAMTLELPETPSHSLSKAAKDEIISNAKSCDVLVIGPGLSQNAETIQLIWEIVFETTKAIVLDADGLTALAMGIKVIKSKESEEYLKDFFAKRKSELILTPHPGEASKLCAALGLDKKYTNKYIEMNKKEIAPILADLLSCTVVLKGHDTTIAYQEKTIVNRVGGPELATAGSGDVLSGIVGSFVGQNPTNHFEAITTAVYLHGLSGKLAKDKFSERSLMASDIIRFLPQAIKIAENE
jgi:NAD(P)H-hydrate epimerase